MSQRRNIVITFAPHARRWFQDISIAAARSIRELGHDCNVITCNKIDDFNRDPYDTILVLAPHTYTQLNLTPNFVKIPGKTYVAWCLEQTPHHDRTCDIMNKHWQRTLTYIDKFDYFFTESECKTKYVIQQGRQAHTATIGYHKHFTTLKDDVFYEEKRKKKKDYDVFFLGAMFPRRSKIISALKERGLKMYPSSNNMFDPIVKANAVNACKVGLNIHHNDVGYFEKPRIIQDYMSNGIMVITENIDHPEDFKSGKQFIMAPYDKLVDTVEYWCKKPQKDRDKIINNALHYISHHYTMKDSMAGLIDVISKGQEKRIEAFTGERFVPTATDEATALQHQNRYEHFQSMAIDKTVLDIACGAGYGTNHLAVVANKTIGIDLDAKTIEHARTMYPLPRFGVGSMLELPYGKNVFDIVFCFEAIEHVSDYKKALIEMSRVLKRDGKLVISTPNKTIVSEGSDIPKNEFHVKEWNLQEFISEVGGFFRKVVTYGQPNKTPWNVRYEAREDDLFFILVCSK